MKHIILICISLIIFTSCGSGNQASGSDSLVPPVTGELSILESKLQGKWDLYRVSEIKNAMPLYDKDTRDNFYVSRKNDWMEFSSNRVYRECWYGETETKPMWFEADDVTMVYRLFNSEATILRIEHYDFKGADTLLTSMDNVQFVWVKR
jgi:hypothetical protein